MTKYIIAYKKEGDDKWHKYAVVNNHAQIVEKVESLYMVISKVEKVQIQKVIR